MGGESHSPHPSRSMVAKGRVGGFSYLAYDSGSLAAQSGPAETAAVGLDHSKSQGACCMGALR